MEGVYGTVQSSWGVFRKWVKERIKKRWLTIEGGETGTGDKYVQRPDGMFHIRFFINSLRVIWLSVLFMSAHTEIGETVVSEFGANKRKKARDDNLCIPGASNWADQRIHVPGC